MKRTAEMLIAAGVAALTGCTTTDNKAAVPALKARTVPVGVADVARALPKAVIYRTTSDVSDHVAVRLTPDGRSLLTFPAPSDVRASSRPLPLTDGWLLDRQGAIGPDTRFLRYTYAGYAALQSTPSPAELMDAIMPGVRVTAFTALDMTPSQAAADTAAVNALIRRGLPGVATPLTPVTVTIPE